MAILSTNQKLIKVDVDYSAGNGIDITSGVISVTGDNAPYSAGQNIYFDGDDNHVINGKDWGNEINDASANAFNTASSWVAQNYANSADMTYISAMVDTKLDTSSFSDVSGNFYTNDNPSGFITGDYASQSAFDELSDSFSSLSSNINTNSGVWDDVVNKLYISSYHELSAGANTDIQGYVISSRDWTNEIAQASANAVNEASDFVSNSGDLYKLEFNGVDLYGYKVSSNIPNYVYSAVSSYLYERCLVL